MVPFVDVIENHVQNDFNSGPMQGFYHVAEFPQVTATFSAHTKSGVRCEEADHAVPPVVGHRPPIHLPAHGRLIEVEHRQQFHRCHTEVLEVRDLLDES
jgi:hypothetical protein